MGPERWDIWVRHPLDGGSNQPGVQSLFQVHLLHRLHGLPLSQLRLDASDVLNRVSTELFVGSLLLLSLLLDG